MALIYLEKYFTENEFRIKREKEEIWKNEIKMLVPNTNTLNTEISSNMKSFLIQKVKKFLSLYNLSQLKKIVNFPDISLWATESLGFSYVNDLTLKYKFYLAHFRDDLEIIIDRFNNWDFMSYTGKQFLKTLSICRLHIFMAYIILKLEWHIFEVIKHKSQLLENDYLRREILPMRLEDAKYQLEDLKNYYQEYNEIYIKSVINTCTHKDIFTIQR